uniref:Uncharacterized protein n=1 Tax=Glossina pallidipes TaxID=7398 RepID=A0A1A9Z6A7_GLOPL
MHDITNMIPSFDARHKTHAVYHAAILDFECGVEKKKTVNLNVALLVRSACDFWIQKKTKKKKKKNNGNSGSSKSNLSAQLETGKMFPVLVKALFQRTPPLHPLKDVPGRVQKIRLITHSSAHKVNEIVVMQIDDN